MRIREAIRSAAVLLAASLVMVGCSTPKALTELTSETGDNAIALSVALANLERQSEETAELRMAAAARLSGIISRVEARRRRERGLIKAYEDANAVNAFAAILKLSNDEVAKIPAAAESAENERKAFKATLKPLDSDADDLRKLGTQLLKFSKEGSRFDRAKFYIAFVKGVIEDLKKADDGKEEAKDKAEESVKKAENSAPK